MAFLKSTKDLFLDFLLKFCKDTSIHGMHFVANTKISKPERLAWFIIVNVALGFTVYLAVFNWQHYLANPIVVGIRKDFRNWENSFPAATGCFVDKVDEEKAKNYIQKKWSVVPQDPNFTYYLDFVHTVSNLTYKTLHDMERFKYDMRLSNVDWISLITEVHPPLKGILQFFQTELNSKWQFVVTEKGLCFSFNSNFAELLSPDFSITLDTDPRLSTKNDNLKCHYLNGLCYARYDYGPKTPIEYHIHPPLEVIHATSEPPLLVKGGDNYEVNYKLTETFSLDEIRYLSPSQRRCRFADEPLTENVPVYGISICYMECRYRLALKKCGCKPFFYNFLGGKQCDIHGLLCLSNISHLFNQPPELFGCNCPQPCNSMVYLKQTPRVTEWEKKFFGERATFRWGLIPPTTKYHRKIIFGRPEFIVSVGGSLSLCVGMSFICMVEVMFLVAEFLFSLSLRKVMNKIFPQVKKEKSEYKCDHIFNKLCNK